MPERYPYDNWFDGQIWDLEQGKDYRGDSKIVAGTIRRASRRRGIKVRVRVYRSNKLAVQKVERYGN